MQEVRERILYRHKEDGYDWLREAYNDIIESRIVEGRQGICQEKFITITVVRRIMRLQGHIYLPWKVVLSIILLRCHRL